MNIPEIQNEIRNHLAYILNSEPKTRIPVNKTGLQMVKEAYEVAIIEMIGDEAKDIVLSWDDRHGALYPTLVVEGTEKALRALMTFKVSPVDKIVNTPIEVKIRDENPNHRIHIKNVRQ